MDSVPFQYLYFEKKNPIAIRRIYLIDSDYSLCGRPREGAHNRNKIFLRTCRTTLRITEVGFRLLSRSMGDKVLPSGEG